MNAESFPDGPTLGRTHLVAHQLHLYTAEPYTSYDLLCDSVCGAHVPLQRLRKA